MIKDCLVTIITPTYNRSDYLPALYDSLLNQTNRNFIWLIVDDGSNDDTKDKVSDFIGEGKIHITYMKQENQGKHVALNYGIEKIETEATFIVDSDDTLSEDAIEAIVKYWPIVRENQLAGISFLRAYSNGEVIGDRYPKELAIDNYTNVTHKKGIKGDKAEIWQTKVLKKYLFPVFPGEKFMGEGYVWNQISKFYNMVFINKVVYFTEYLDGGLSRSGRTLRIQNPQGGMEHAKICLGREFGLRQRTKNAWLYISYGIFSAKKLSAILSESKNKALVVCNLPFGIVLYLYWKNKYGK